MRGIEALSGVEEEEAHPTSSPTALPLPWCYSGASRVLQDGLSIPWEAAGWEQGAAREPGTGPYVEAKQPLWVSELEEEQVRHFLTCRVQISPGGFGVGPSAQG